MDVRIPSQAARRSLQIIPLEESLLRKEGRPASMYHMYKTPHLGIISTLSRIPMLILYLHFLHFALIERNAFVLSEAEGEVHVFCCVVSYLVLG